MYNGYHSELLFKRVYLQSISDGMLPFATYHSAKNIPNNYRHRYPTDIYIRVYNVPVGTC